MVDQAVPCEHCGLETRHPVVAVIGGRELNFCCGGCKQVYEFLVAENLLDQVKDDKPASNETGT